MLTSVQMVLCLLMLTQNGEVSLSTHLDNLNSPTYALRQATTQELMQLQSLTDQQLNDLYRQAQSPEQQYRLRQIAMHHCLRQWISKQIYKDRASSIGVRFHALKPDPEIATQPAGIMVDATLPGFPAHEYLQAGDLITEINTLKLTAKITNIDLSKVFPTVIKQLSAGTQITLKIIREGQPLQVQFPTAPALSLKDLYAQKQIMKQSMSQLTPFASKLWYDRLQALISKPKQPEPHKKNPQISIQWQTNAP